MKKHPPENELFIDPSLEPSQLHSPEHLLKPAGRGGVRLDIFLDAYLSERRNTTRFPTVKRKKWRLRPRLTIGVLILLVMIGVNLSPAGKSFWLSVEENYRCSQIQTPSQSPTRAVALIDQLASQYPDPSFVEAVRSETVSSGLRFDYIGPNGATVDYFANLPRYDYSLVIMRIHGSLVGAPVLATSEKYKQDSHVAQQIWDRIGAVKINNTLYFALEAPFVTHEMCGRFPGTMILVMGCDGFDKAFGDAFVQRGASALVGWDKAVTVAHTDSAFEQLVKLLLAGGTVSGSVQSVMDSLGPDPQTGSSLGYFPLQAAASTL